MKLAEYIVIRIKSTILLFLLLCIIQYSYALSIDVRIIGYKGRSYLSYLIGEKVFLVDSIDTDANGFYKIDESNKTFHIGFYRVSFDHNKWIDFVNEGEDIRITTNTNSVLDSLQVVNSESNKLYYTFIKLNKLYKTETELLQLTLNKYPKEDDYYRITQNKLTQLQNEYMKFVNVTAQKYPNSFIAKYIHSAQLPVINISIQPQQQSSYLKAHALDNVDFNNSSLIYSDVFTNKAIEYLTYYRNPQLPKELLEKEFMSAVDSILYKAKVNQVVYQHITEYLIDGFKKFGFDKILDFIVENYVIKDDLCLDVKTEGLIKRRIDQAKLFKVGGVVPNIVIADTAGYNIRLNKITSKNILIVFYASWCPHCKELLPQLNELYKTQKEKKLEVLAISLDAKKEDWTGFINANCPSIVNVSDLKGWEGKTAINYSIYATPTMFMIDWQLKIITKPMSIEEVKSIIN